MTSLIRLNTFILCSLCLLASYSNLTAWSSNRAVSLDIGKIADRNSSISFLEQGDEFDEKVLKITPDSSTQRITIWEQGDPGNWSDVEYLVFEAAGLNDYSGRISIEFYREDKREADVDLQSGKIKHEENPRLLSLQGLLPHLKTKMVFPLSYLDAQDIFLPRYPRQLKGTITGSRIAPNEISKVMLRFGPYQKPHFIPEFEIASINLQTNLPDSYSPLDEPIVDSLGQWKQKDWPGKANSEDKLIEQSHEQLKAVQNESYPDEWSKYGGWKEKQLEATGFFRTHHDGDRWWLVDPEGYAFISAGVTGIGYHASGPVEGIEDFFEWLPDEDSRFEPAIGEGREMKSVDFLRTNLIRSFGEEWEDKWSQTTAGLMKKFQLNTVANWSNLEFAREHNLPYVLQLNNFPSTDQLLFRDFPDVFSDQYLKASVEYARQLEEFKEDPYLIGYFLINEPHWGFGYHNLSFEMFVTSASSDTKVAFIEWIKDQYQNDISGLNDAWNLALDNFEELNQITFDDYPSETAEEDFHEFSKIMVRKYVDVPCDEVEKIAPNHLNLGMRYAWISSDLMYTAGERFDVFSINGYGNPDPPETDEISHRSGKPVMIGEWHFGATDRGLPATGIQGALNQQQRAKAYRYYAEQAFARPELVGIHYFQWNDQPYYGRFDGENYNIGIVDITNQPYPELTIAMSEANKRMYKVAAGLADPFDEIIEKVPSIHY